MDVSTPRSTTPLRSRESISRKQTATQENKNRPKITPRNTRLAPVGNSRKRAPPKINSSQPRSPRDTTPLILNGQEINREDIPPIVIPSERNFQEKPVQNQEIVEEMDIRPASPEKKQPSNPDNQEAPRDGFSFPNQVYERLQPPPIIPQAESKDEEEHQPSPTEQNQGNIETEDDNGEKQEEIQPPVIAQPPTPVKVASRTPTPVKTPQQPPTPVKVVQQKEIPKKKTSAEKSKVIRRVETKQPKKEPPKEEPKKPAVKKLRKALPKKLQPPDFTKMDQRQRISVLVTYRKRFMNLREAFPGLGIRNIPEDYDPTPANLALLHEEYDGYMTHILISEDVSQSMIILIVFLGGIELFLTKVLGLPASNYVIKQFKLINKYRALLYELGEERLANGGGQSPPLVRLIYLVLLTSIATVGVRLLESSIGKTGANMAEDIIYGILGGGGADVSNGDPTENAGGFDLNGILKFVGGFLGGNNAASAKQEPRGPTYNE